MKFYRVTGYSGITPGQATLTHLYATDENLEEMKELFNNHVCIVEEIPKGEYEYFAEIQHRQAMRMMTGYPK